MIFDGLLKPRQATNNKAGIHPVSKFVVWDADEESVDLITYEVTNMETALKLSKPVPGKGM